MPPERRPGRPVSCPKAPTKNPTRITDAQEEELNNARAYFLAGQYSIVEVAKKFGVSYHTLRRRILGTSLPKKLAHDNQRLLSPAEEKTLVDWARYLGNMARPINKRTIRPKVLDILRNRGVKIKENTVSRLDPKRAKAFNYTTVNRHFELLKSVLDENDIPWENVYNMDEKGIQLGGGRRGSQEKYFFDSEDQMMYRLQSDDLQLVTIIDCVGADGTAEIKPCFVFSGVMKCPEWFEVDDEILVATSPNGWTDDEVGFEWFKRCFVPQAKARNTSGKPILLIYDGHGSHTLDTWAEHGFENNVILYCLPPHTTHRLQPLDVGCFGPLQNAWFRQCDIVLNETGQGMELKDVVKEYMNAREVPFVEKNVFAAWRKSGIKPFNPGIFTDANFAPSKVSFTWMHVPSSFPTRVPRAPDASSDDLFFDPAEFLQRTRGDNDSDSDSDSNSGSNSNLDFDLDEGDKEAEAGDGD
ncbi:DDE-domain-containing protein, partial [Dendrothele bispora CBS 962.96]